jgi:DNA-binding NarL/FixJ family response regulator
MVNRYKVFVVDDEPVFLKMIEDELSDNHKLEIKTFLSGEDCILQLHEKPDIVVLDHNLERESKSNLNGLKLLDIIRKNQPEVHAIILSGQLMPDIIFDFIMGKGVDKYIVKGEDAFEQLNEAILNIISK